MVCVKYSPLLYSRVGTNQPGDNVHAQPHLHDVHKLRQKKHTRPTDDTRHVARFHLATGENATHGLHHCRCGQLIRLAEGGEFLQQQMQHTGQRNDGITVLIQSLDEWEITEGSTTVYIKNEFMVNLSYLKQPQKHNMIIMIVCVCVHDSYEGNILRC